MTTDKSDVVLYDGHRVTVRVSGDNITGTQVSREGRSVIEEHSFILVIPGYSGDCTVWSFDISSILFDVLSALYIV